MSSSLCPHLVQEYFGRVADILTVYRPQILKLVEYDKISENLVLRGAVRQEEHQRIFQCANSEGQVSQMLVVIQNRMWGLENLLAAFMDEHVSTWLTQELFRAYMEHLVNPLRKQRDNPVCQCVQLPNSILYRGWVQALKSLDSLILKTGTSLGFMKQTMYPTENMLAFLSEKLAQYTGGDSLSTTSHDELVAYGFAPNTAGEVQVAELEEDDINDLFSLSETLCIGYHSSSDEPFKTTTDDHYLSDKSSSVKNASYNKGSIDRMAVVAKPVQRQSTSKTRTDTKIFSRAASLDTYGDTRYPDYKMADYEQQKPLHSENINQEDKIARQRQLIERLSAPKSVKVSSSSSSVRLRNSPSSSSTTDPKQGQRPRSEEFQRSVSMSPSTLTTASSTTTSLRNTCDLEVEEYRSSSEKKAATNGKTQGFVRSKSHGPISPRSRRLSPKSKPTAVTKPNMKDILKKTSNKSLEKQHSEDREEEIDCCSAEVEANDNIDDEDAEKHDHEDFLLKNTKLFTDEENQDINNDQELDMMLPGMSSLLLSNTILANNGEEKSKSLTYYQLNFDNYSENE